MEENITQEQIDNSISAAFDSVSLINGIINGSQMQNESQTEKDGAVERNVGHLNVMLSKSWFAEALSISQETDINDAVAAGNSYLAS